MTLLPTLSYLSDIYFEAGAVSKLPQLLEKLDIGRPLIVTDAPLVKLGMVDRLDLPDAAVFADIQSNPSEASVEAGRQAYLEQGCDGIVALGGGSPLDCAKCIGLMATHPGPLEQYAFLNGGLPKISADKPKLIAVPTTAGTGSEVGRAALITMRGGGKKAFLSPLLIPDAVICDPALTLNLPPALTAATGMDAISHCVENFCGPKYNPVADAIALDGLQRGYRAIRRAFADGQDLQVRQEMMMASLQGGLTFQKGLGFVHALSHPLGGLPEKRLHHGTLNAVFLPHVLEFNMDACPDKMDAMAGVLELGDRHQLPRLFDDLNNDLGLPTSLSQMGVVAADLAPLATQALDDHCSRSNPRPVALDDCASLFAAAL